jgi:hypothetical protein
VTNTLAYFAPPSATKKQKFVTVTIGADVIKISFFNKDERPNKIDRFSLASLSIPVLYLKA